MNPCQALSEPETALLAELEAQIERDLEAIRTLHLYRGVSEDFDDYLRQWFKLESAGGDQ